MLGGYYNHPDRRQQGLGLRGKAEGMVRSDWTRYITKVQQTDLLMDLTLMAMGVGR